MNNYRHAIPFVLVSMFGCFSGCGEGPVSHELNGRVLLDNKPVNEARILLHPRGIENAATAKPHAIADVNGAFTIALISIGDGPPFGHYVGTVELREERTIGEDKVRDGRNSLPAKYAKPATSPFRVDFNDVDMKLIPDWHLLDRRSN